jgi:adenylate cyclase
MNAVARISRKQRHSIEGWILSEGRRLADAKAFLDGVMAEFRRAGIPVERALFSLLVIHPQAAATGFEWHLDQPTVEIMRERSIKSAAVYLQSPIKRIHDGTDFLHARLAGPRGSHEFPVFDEFRADGFTDYAAFAVPFGNGTRNALTLTTRRPRGFTAAQIGLVRSVLPLIAMVFEIHWGRRIAEAVLDTYVGRHASGRILAGSIDRGQGERIDAVIWFADLRSFTALSDLRPTGEVIAALNQFFDALAGAIESHGGQILKFMGDGLLAIFPVEDAAFRHYACREALAAAIDAHQAVDALNVGRAAEGAPILRFNVALHVGVVVYGNIGSATRLDFTCIGPAVNLTVRIEALAAKLGAPVAMSSAFAAMVREGRAVVSLGKHSVKGLMAPPEVFTLAEFAPAPAWVSAPPKTEAA